MSYKLVDPIIFNWARKHSLHVFTSYKDEEVRSIDIVSKKGQRFQICVDQPLDHNINVHAWNYKNIKKEWSVEINNLNSTLEEAFESVIDWMKI